MIGLTTLLHERVPFGLSCRARKRSEDEVRVVDGGNVDVLEENRAASVVEQVDLDAPVTSRTVTFRSYHDRRTPPPSSEQKVARVQIREREVVQHDGAPVVCAQVDAHMGALLACAHIAITRQSVRTQVDEVLAIGEVHHAVAAIGAPEYELTTSSRV